MPFTQVIEKYGYPVISKETAQKIREVRTTKSEKLKNKRLYGDEWGNGKLSEKWKFLINAPFKISERCCHVMKKGPIKKYAKETGRGAIVGTMAADSRLRKTAYLSTVVIRSRAAQCRHRWHFGWKQMSGIISRNTIFHIQKFTIWDILGRAACSACLVCTWTKIIALNA